MKSLNLSNLFSSNNNTKLLEKESENLPAPNTCRGTCLRFGQTPDLEQRSRNRSPLWDPAVLIWAHLPGPTPFSPRVRTQPVAKNNYQAETPLEGD